MKCIFVFANTAGEETGHLDPSLASSLLRMRLALWALCTRFGFDQSAEGPGLSLAVTQQQPEP